jgi:MFS family permease
MRDRFYGWWIVAAAFITFGLSVGLPYYNEAFFYDYYMKAHGWERSALTLGFPLASLITFVGPFIVPRFRPRYLILAGTLMSFIAFVGFAKMGGQLWVFYLCCFIYMVGYILSGPVAHQIVISQWFRKKRGFAMGVTYVGVGLVGAAGSKLVKWLTPEYGYQATLIVVGALIMLAWPVALWLMKDRPSDIGQFPDGLSEASAEIKLNPLPYRDIVKRRAFWLLLIGSACSIGSIGAVNKHMKLVLKDNGYESQEAVNAAWAEANFWILISSIAGRLLVGYLADRFPKKYVMVATYLVVACSIPLLLLVKPHDETYLYVFAAVFGFAMGADYMLIPLMAAEQFGVNTLARAMAVILPTDTLGQFWSPYGLSLLYENLGRSYGASLPYIYGLSFAGALAIALLPRHDEEASAPAK